MTHKLPPLPYDYSALEPHNNDNGKLKLKHRID